MNSYHKKKQRYIITGGLGFIGTNFIKFLLSKKNVEILNLDKISYASNNFLIKNKNNLLKNIKVNLKNEKKVKKIIENFKPNKLIHFAAESHVDRSIDSPFKFISENILSTLSLLSNTLDFYNKYKNKITNFEFVYIGTDEIYGDLEKTKNKFSEKSLISPNNPYSSSKASCYHLVNAFNKTYDLPVKRINFCNNFGEFQFPEKLIPKTILSIINRKPVHLYGNGLQIRNWIYATDTSKKLYNVINYKKKKPVFNISSNLELNNLELIKIIHKLTNKVSKKNYPLKLKYVVDRPGHDQRYSLIDNTFEKTTKYTKKDFSIRLAEVIRWYLNNDNLSYFNNTKIIFNRIGIQK